MIRSLSISGLLTLDLHALNNEGAEGNTMMTRMVDIIDAAGRKHTVNAVSGDMFKHIQAEHLHAEAAAKGLRLCGGCRDFNANRICADESFTRNPDFTKDTPDSTILTKALETCVIDDCEGILITNEIGKKRSIARKSCIEFGWVVGKPEHVTTDSYFHAKYVPEGRGKGSGAGENLGQNIFHRPASSGQYAVNVNVDLYRVGRNDITLQCSLDEDMRRTRTAALLRSLLLTFVKPTGAHRNTQNPHIVDFSGVISVSRSPIPAPVVSALKDSYREEIGRLRDTLNRTEIGDGAVSTNEFDSLADFADRMADYVAAI